MTTQPLIWATVPQMTTTRAPKRSTSAPTGPVTASATTAIRPMSSPATSSGMPRTSCT